MRHNLEPLLRWKYNEKKYLAVSRVTTKYLSVVATCIPYERLLGKTGRVVTKRGNRSSPDGKALVPRDATGTVGRLIKFA